MIVSPTSIVTIHVNLSCFSSLSHALLFTIPTHSP